MLDNTILYYTMGRNHRQSYGETDTSRLLSTIDESNAIFKKYEDSIVAYFNNNSGEYQEGMWGTTDWTTWGNMGCVQFMLSPNVGGQGMSRCQFTLDRIRSWMSMNAQVAAKLKTETIGAGDVVILTMDDKQAYLVTVIDGARCSICDQVQPVDGLPEHQKTVDCYIKGEVARAKIAGFEPLKFTRTDDVLKAKGVTRIMVPIYAQAYVQPWVNQAIDSFGQNDGYAGMTITEFIDKMAPDTEK